MDKAKKKEKNKKEKENNNEPKEDEITFKIITLGDSGVGKTSIIERYIKGTFQSNNASTLGVNFSFKNLYINGTQKIILKLLDTSGQEKYKSLSKSYFKNADGVLFVFGLNDKDSFDNIKDWMIYFSEHCSIENIPKILVGNKCDLERDKGFDPDLIKEFVGEINIKYFETSAKDDKNINELFEEMGKTLYKKGLPLEKQKGKIIISKEVHKKKTNKCVKCFIDF